MDVFVGIDVSKDRLDICVRPSGETFAVGAGWPYPRPARWPKGRRRPAKRRFFGSRRRCRGMSIFSKSNFPSSIGKAGKQALTAYIRKLLVILNGILRDRKPWSLSA